MDWIASINAIGMDSRLIGFSLYPVITGVREAGDGWAVTGRVPAIPRGTVDR